MFSPAMGLECQGISGSMGTKLILHPKCNLIVCQNKPSITSVQHITKTSMKFSFHYPHNYFDFTYISLGKVSLLYTWSVRNLLWSHLNLFLLLLSRSRIADVWQFVQFNLTFIFMCSISPFLLLSMLWYSQWTSVS